MSPRGTMRKNSEIVKRIARTKTVRYANSRNGSRKMTAAMISSNTTVWPINISSEAREEIRNNWIQFPSITVWEERDSSSTCMMVPARKRNAKIPRTAPRLPLRSKRPMMAIKNALKSSNAMSQRIMAGTGTGKSGVCILFVI